MKDYKRAFMMTVTGLISWLIAILVSYLCHAAPADSIMECIYGLCTGMFALVGFFLLIFAVYIFWDVTGRKDINNLN